LINERIWQKFLEYASLEWKVLRKGIYLPVACPCVSVGIRKGRRVKFKYSEDERYNDLVTAVRAGVKVAPDSVRIGG